MSLYELNTVEKIDLRESEWRQNGVVRNFFFHLQQTQPEDLLFGDSWSVSYRVLNWNGECLSRWVADWNEVYLFRRVGVANGKR